MFGAAQMGHDERYDYADEWVTVLKRLWTETEFDYAGRFLNLKGSDVGPQAVAAAVPRVDECGRIGPGQAVRRPQLRHRLHPAKRP